MMCMWCSQPDAHETLSFLALFTIQNGSAFLVPAYPGCPAKETIKWLNGVLHLTIRAKTCSKRSYLCVCVVHNLLTFLAHYNERILYVMLVQI